ncbi:unnamed protein product [Effrenium voratum]|uniref:Uncharacterized protein n=1 Tax=Effrenium voratum TaxID=2562239 RepID=A0AA36JH76_9DINO|nr:unnamed protein product [Effrenium voratum]
MWGFGPVPAESAAQRKDPRWAEARPAGLEIRGAGGLLGDHWTNGIYELEASDADAPPVYALRAGPFERFLYWDTEQYWRLGSCEYKDQAKASAGSMRSAEQVPPGTPPTAVAAWMVRVGFDVWMPQEVIIKRLGQNGYSAG